MKRAVSDQLAKLTKRKVLVLVILLLSLVVALPLVLKTPVLLKGQAQSGSASLSLISRSSSHVRAGESVEIDVVLTTEGRGVIGGDLVLKFDRSKLKLRTIHNPSHAVFRTYLPLAPDGGFDSVAVVNRANSDGVAEYGFLGFDEITHGATGEFRGSSTISTLSFDVLPGAVGAAVVRFVQVGGTAESGYSASTDTNVVVVGPGATVEDILSFGISSVSFAIDGVGINGSSSTASPDSGAVRGQPAPELMPQEIIVSAAVDQGSLGSCSRQVHDKYVIRWKDGKSYRTWHPRKDLQSGCVFGHEHGDDPARSTISDLQPVLFSLYDQGSESHEGFKVAVINVGDANNERSISLNGTRIVVHQGTSGARRFGAQMHSLEIGFLGGPKGANVGQRFFLGGMADTGGVGSICDTPRMGKTVMQTDCEEKSAYEIWSFKLQGMTVSWAVFDPMTQRSPSDNTVIPLPGNKWCRHEVYAGPFNGTAGTYAPQFGKLAGGIGYLATYKGGDVRQPQSQFKITRPVCEYATEIGNKN